jgi:bifunctional non-homologous end joining protein LigD
MPELIRKVSGANLLGGAPRPVAWGELSKIKSGAQWTIANAREHLSFQTIDPWADYWKKKQTLARAMKILGFRSSNGKSSV